MYKREFVTGCMLEGVCWRVHVRVCVLKGVCLSVYIGRCMLVCVLECVCFKCVCWRVLGGVIVVKLKRAYIQMFITVLLHM